MKFQSTEEQDLMIAEVVDYSSAQANGFKTAYANCRSFIADQENWNKHYIHAISLLKGCKEHFGPVRVGYIESSITFL